MSRRILGSLHAFVGAAIIMALGAAAVTAARDDVSNAADGFGYVQDLTSTADVVLLGVLVLVAVFSLLSVAFGALAGVRGTTRRGR